MQKKRSDRVGHLIQMEISNLLLHRVKDPRIGFVTVTHVGVAPDMKSARVFYSVIGDKAAQTACGEGLRKAAGFLQREIGIALKLRYTPHLTFEYDDTIDRRMEIDKVLKQIKQTESSEDEKTPQA